MKQIKAHTGETAEGRQLRAMIEDGETEEQRMGKGRRGDVDSYIPSGILIFELRFSM